MAASTFDSLEASRKLKQAGIEQQHAEAIADQLRSAAGADLNQLATSANLAELRADIYRALWIQGAGIVLIIGPLIAIVAALQLIP